MKQKNLVLMVVAVGCGLVAAFLTSQMSAKPAQVEKIKVVVATKDLTVGTLLTAEDLEASVKFKEVSKDSVPQTVVETKEELIDKRLTRTIRADEMINKADVTKGMVVSIPPGMSMVSMQISGAQAVAGFVGPGAKVDVLGTIKLHNQTTSLPILVNMLVLAVDANVALPDKSAAYQSVSTVSFAVDRKQALLLELAKARNCQMSLLLRNPEEKVTENDKAYNIDEVVKLLGDQRERAEIKGRNDPEKRNDGGATPRPQAGSVEDDPAPRSETVKVPVALVDIAPGTDITTDLIDDATKFGMKELPKDVAADAITDLRQVAGQVFKTGLGKGQWATKSLVGQAALKAPPRDVESPSKPGPAEAEAAAPKTTPAGQKTHDVAVHTSSGTRYFRYVEVKPGEWKLTGEVRANDKTEKPAAEADAAPWPTAPKKATPEKDADKAEKKVD